MASNYLIAKNLSQFFWHCPCLPCHVAHLAQGPGFRAGLEDFSTEAGDFLAEALSHGPHGDGKPYRNQSSAELRFQCFRIICALNSWSHRAGPKGFKRISSSTNKDKHEIMETKTKQPVFFQVSGVFFRCQSL